MSNPKFCARLLATQPGLFASLRELCGLTARVIDSSGSTRILGSFYAGPHNQTGRSD